MKKTRKNKFTYNDVLLKFHETHGNRYNYDNVKYVNTAVLITVTCSIHGDFKIRPGDHWRGGGCRKCSLEKSKISREEWINRFNSVHNFKYDYSLSSFNKSNESIVIICPNHGEFTQIVNNHYKNHGCPKCSFVQIGIKNSKPLSHYISQANKIHNFKYTYDDSSDISLKNNKLIITCGEHGNFTKNIWNHLTNKQGCPKCSDYGRYSEKWFNDNPSKKSISGILYFIKFYNDSETFYKIGITKHNSTNKRWRGKIKGYIPEILYEYKSDLYNCFSIEQKLLNELIYKNRYHPKNKIGGDYECFKDEELVENIKQHFIKLCL